MHVKFVRISIWYCNFFYIQTIVIVVAVSDCYYFFYEYENSDWGALLLNEAVLFQRTSV